VKKKPRPRNFGKTPDRLSPYDFVSHCARLLKSRVAAGVYRDRPGLEATITEWEPAIALIEIGADPATTPEMKTVVASKLMPCWHKEQSVLVREADGQTAPTQIVIQVANWAAKSPVMPALPAPAGRVAEAIDVDVVRTNGVLPSPPLSSRERLRQQVLAQREMVVIESPVSPSESAHVIGRVSQGKPYELSESERQHIMETLQKGPQ
jgi:hypothetical protein